MDPEETRENARNQYRAKIAELEAERALYENDFATLSQVSDLLAKLYTACDVNTSAAASAGFTLNEIYNLGTSDKVPGFEKLFKNFGDDITTELSEVNSVNNRCISELRDTGSQVDNAKSIVAGEIRKINIDINFYNECLSSI